MRKISTKQQQNILLFNNKHHSASQHAIAFCLLTRFLCVHLAKDSHSDLLFCRCCFYSNAIAKMRKQLPMRWWCAKPREKIEYNEHQHNVYTQLITLMLLAFFFASHVKKNIWKGMDFGGFFKSFGFFSATFLTFFYNFTIFYLQIYTFKFFYNFSFKLIKLIKTSY